MNMPFELGIDFGCRQFGSGQSKRKSILILENKRYDYQRALSDISGWDICAHDGDHLKAVRHVSTWLSRQANAPSVGTTRILGQYSTFQAWYWRRETERGSSEEDIRAYPTIKMVDAMRDWENRNRPVV